MIDETIRSGSFPSTSELSRKAEVTRRTIERDIEYLRDIYQAPIEYDHQKRGYYYSQPNFFIKSVVLTEGEFFSIALFERLLEQYRNIPIETALRKVFDKIVKSLPEEITVDSAFLNEKITVIPGHQGEIDPNVFEKIFTALKTRRTLTFEYRPLQKTTYMARTVDPYNAICQKANWYFIGYCHDKKELRTFSFSRTKNVKVTKKHFQIPADFKPEKHFDKGDGGIWIGSNAVHGGIADSQ
jgi:predicted DNA-binding transcriptional regulator YafY